MKKQIATGVLLAIAILVGAAATTHAAAGDTPHSLSNCLACGLCEMLGNLLH